MPSLVLGGSGQLGTAILGLRPDATAPSHHDLDLADVGQVYKKVVRFRPSAIINCAGYTDVDGAEDHPDEAITINGDAVGELARAAHDLTIPFVTFSSDYVFDGRTQGSYTESSTPAPINVYGESKLVGEQAALGFAGSLVIRTSWLVSATHRNFVSAIVERARQGLVRVVNDQWGGPTMVNDLAKASVGAMEQGCSGVLHLSGHPATTWFELARTAAAAVGLDTALVAPCRTTDYPSKADRPARSVLASERLPVGSPLVMPEWPAGLTELLPDILARLSNSG